MSKKPEWEAYDPKVAWKWHDWAEKRIHELEAKLERVRELPARGTQSVIMIGGYWINRADLMEALADD